MKLRDIDRAFIQKIAAAFRWMPQGDLKLSPNLLTAEAPRFRNSVMAPLYLQSSKLRIADLSKIEAYFKLRPKRSEYDYDTPYLLCPNIPYIDWPSIESATNRAGWTEVQYSKRQPVWLKPIPIELNHRYEVAFGVYQDGKLLRDHLRIAKKNFDPSKALVDDIDFLHRKVAKKIKVLVIYDRRKPVASGLTHTVGQSTYLYMGSVLPEYRNQGLWNLLLSARQAITNTGDGHIWSLWSDKEHIVNKGDFILKFRCFVKR